jgi:hypothetical protein
MQKTYVSGLTGLVPSQTQHSPAPALCQRPSSQTKSPLRRSALFSKRDPPQSQAWQIGRAPSSAAACWANMGRPPQGCSGGRKGQYQRRRKPGSRICDHFFVVIPCMIAMCSRRMHRKGRKGAAMERESSREGTDRGSCATQRQAEPCHLSH